MDYLFSGAWVIEYNPAETYLDGSTRALQTPQGGCSTRAAPRGLLHAGCSTGVAPPGVTVLFQC